MDSTVLPRGSALLSAADTAGLDTQLWFALMHLCFYERRGTRPTFYMIVERAFSAVGVSLSVRERAQLSGNIFQKLLLFGIVSKSPSDNGEEWCSGVNRLLSTPAGILPVGDSDFTRSVLREVPEQFLAKHLVAPISNVRSGLNLWAPIISHRDLTGSARVQQLGGKLVVVDSRRLVEALPSHKEVFAQLTRKIQPADVVAVMEGGEPSIYDFDCGTWRDAPRGRQSNTLYKVQYEYGPSRWLLISAAGAFEVSEGDWAVNLARAEFRLPLAIKHSNSSSKASIQRNHLQELPLLVRMFLTSFTYQWPSLTDDRYQFSGVERSLLAILAAKLPSLEMIDE